MTGKEIQEKNKEWLKTVKEGDEVCLSNSHDQVKMMLGGMMGGFGPNSLFGGYTPNEPPEGFEEVVEILTVRAILPDGCILVGSRIFTADGIQEGLDSESFSSWYYPSLIEPTEELRELAQLLKFSKDIKGVPWRRFNIDVIRQLTQVINEEMNRLNDEYLKAEEEKKKKAEEEKATRTAMTGLTSKHLVPVTEKIESMISHVNHRCPDCPHAKEEGGGEKNESGN